MNGDFIEALEQIEREKGIPMASLIATVEAAMASAYRRHYGDACEIRLDVDREKGEVKMFSRRPLVPEGAEAALRPAGSDEDGIVSTLTLEEQESGLGPIEYEEKQIDAGEFGRIAAQTAKQVVVQRIREAERELVFDEFSHRVGELVTGEVQRKDQRNVFIALGRVEALLPGHEQIPGEPYRFGDRLKLYILDVRKTTKHPQVIVSRTHPGLVTRLFELEVPEVYDGIVVLRSVAREPGARSKVAVESRDPSVDPLGACVGHRGARVQAIVDELRGEKIDIVRYNDDIRTYLESALSPAKVGQVLIDEDERAATVIVPDHQLSLAIGRRGQNVRLAARLTGWRIDIRSETQWAEEPRPAAPVAAPVEVTVEALAAELGVAVVDLQEIADEEGIELGDAATVVAAEHAATLRALLAGGEGTLDDLEAGAITIEAEAPSAE
jgi:N utilization substance protein A